MKKEPHGPDTAESHDNKQANAVYLAAMRSREFPDPSQALEAFEAILPALIEVSDEPAEVVALFEQHTEGMTDAQKLFVAKKVSGYFLNTVFGEEGKEEIYFEGISSTLGAYAARLERTLRPQVADLRTTLKEVFREEIGRLPETLKALEPKDRLNFLCKVMPFILPKVEAVEATEGDLEGRKRGW